MRPWLWAGHEWDKFKVLAGHDPRNATDRRAALYILNDDDATNYETDCECSSNQTKYGGTRAGLIAFGATNSSDFADAGTCGFQQEGGEPGAS